MSDLILLEKKQICYIVDVACPFDPQIEKEMDKEKDYTNLKYEILKMWKNQVTKVYIVLVVIGLGMVLKNISRYVENVCWEQQEF